MRRKQTVRQLKEGKTRPRKHLVQPWIPHIKHQAHLVQMLHESQVSLAPGYKYTGFALPQQYWTRKASQLPRPSCPGHLVLSGMALHRSPHPQEHTSHQHQSLCLPVPQIHHTQTSFFFLLSFLLEEEKGLYSSHLCNTTAHITVCIQAVGCSLLSHSLT